jgi:hypothetical protein
VIFATVSEALRAQLHTSAAMHTATLVILAKTREISNFPPLTRLVIEPLRLSLRHSRDVFEAAAVAMAPALL